jgi:cobyrinic acid a,c-diamide synthase
MSRSCERRLSLHVRSLSLAQFAKPPSTHCPSATSDWFLLKNTPDTATIQEDLLKLADGFDLDAIISIARSAPSLETGPPEVSLSTVKDIKVGYLRDSAFSFYYPENLEQLEQGGAELIPISSIRSSALPEGCALCTSEAAFQKNTRMPCRQTGVFWSRSGKRRGRLCPSTPNAEASSCSAKRCAGKAQRIRWPEFSPSTWKVFNTPQGHGYSELLVDTLEPALPCRARSSRP